MKEPNSFSILHVKKSSYLLCLMHAQKSLDYKSCRGELDKKTHFTQLQDKKTVKRNLKAPNSILKSYISHCTKLHTKYTQNYIQNRQTKNQQTQNETSHDTNYMHQNQNENKNPNNLTIRRFL